MIIHVHGAGISGCVAARLLAEKGHTVKVFETRSTVGGNAHDYENAGTRVHMYGPHLFHSNDDGVVEFLSRFTSWIPYKHKVVARTVKGLIKLPIVDTSLSCDTSVVDHPNSDELFNLVYKYYSMKQWGTIPAKEVLNRVMIKCKEQDGYFTDKFQALPKNGYTEMCIEMLRHTNIDLIYKHSGLPSDCNLRIWTGTIDSYYKHSLGDIKYRSLNIHTQVEMDGQEATTVNECTLDAHYTRTTDYGMLPTGTLHIKQIEVPCDYKPGVNEPYYPVGDKLYDEYAKLPYDGTIFIGRLAEYKYFDMDKAVRNCMDRINEILI